MPRVLNASCVAGVVTAGSLPVTEVAILSEGVSSSTGYLILDQDRKYYVAKTSPDLKTAINSLGSLLTNISTIMASIVAGMAGSGTAPPPTFAADKVALDLAITQFQATKDLLK